MRKDQEEKRQDSQSSSSRSTKIGRQAAAREQEKRNSLVAAQLKKMLDLGLVTVHLNATLPEVDVPPELKGDEHLLINLSYRFARADLTLTAKAAIATLTFGDKSYRCVLPFKSIYICQSAVSGQLSFYPENMPQNLLRQLEAMQKISKEEYFAEEEPAKAPKAVKQGKLKVISGGAAAKKNRAPADDNKKKINKTGKRPGWRVLSGGKEE